MMLWLLLLAVGSERFWVHVCGGGAGPVLLLQTILSLNILGRLGRCKHGLCLLKLEGRRGRL